MTARPDRPLPTPELVARVAAAERDCMSDWLQAMAGLPGNPFGITIAPFGHATALVCRTIPAQVFNRVLGLTVDDRDQIPEIVDFYARNGASPAFDLDPYLVPPYWIEPNVFPNLVRAGFHHGAFHQILYGVPSDVVASRPTGVEVRRVEAEDADAFCWVYDQVWGGSGAVRVLLDHPRFRCYLASVDGSPAALGILHVASGVGSMANGLTIPAFRNRGCQTALLRRRVTDASKSGCDLLASQCMPGGSSQNNQLRVGLHIAGSKAWWVTGT